MPFTRLVGYVPENRIHFFGRPFPAPLLAHECRFAGVPKVVPAHVTLDASSFEPLRPTTLPFPANRASIYVRVATF